MPFDDFFDSVKSKANAYVGKGADAVRSFVDNATIQSVIGSGNGTSQTDGIWKFPLTLDDTQHTSRLAFNATDAIQGNEGTSMRSKAFGNYKQLKYKNIGTVFLYMPEIETAYTQNFNDDGRGLMWQLNNAIMKGGGYEQLFGPAGVNALKTAAGEVANNVAPNLIRDFTRAVKNQHNSANFTGTQLRRQKFSFDLRPRNPAELVQIAGLIKFFKANSSTSLNEGDFIRVPSRWVIEEMARNVEQRIIPPFKFGPAFLIDVNVDFTPDGVWRTFENGDPIAIRLTLEFMEITIVTREDIQTLDI